MARVTSVARAMIFWGISMLSGYTALIICILFTVGMVQAIRLAQHLKCNIAWVFAINYLVCALGSCVWWAMRTESPLGSNEYVFGVLVGVALVVGLFVINFGVRNIGVGVTQTLDRVSAVLLPTLVSMIFWDGNPGTLKLVGLGMVLGTFVLIGTGQSRTQSAAPSEDENPSTSLHKVLMVILGLVVFSGGIGVLLKAYSEKSTLSPNPVFITFMFIIATIVGFMPVIYQKIRLERREVKVGILVGVLNLIALIAYYTAIAKLDGIIVFPSMAAGVIVLGTAVSWKVWQERYNKWTLAGIVSACVALVLVNWPG